MHTGLAGRALATDHLEKAYDRLDAQGWLPTPTPMLSSASRALE